MMRRQTPDSSPLKPLFVTSSPPVQSRFISITERRRGKEKRKLRKPLLATTPIPLMSNPLNPGRNASRKLRQRSRRRRMLLRTPEGGNNRRRRALMQTKFQISRTTVTMPCSTSFVEPRTRRALLRMRRINQLRVHRRLRQAHLANVLRPSLRLRRPQLLE